MGQAVRTRSFWLLATAMALAVLAAAPAVLMMGKPRKEWAEVARAPEL